MVSCNVITRAFTSFEFINIKCTHEKLSNWYVAHVGVTFIQDEYQQFIERYIDGLVQERRNSNALAVELRISCINPSI